MFIPRLLYSCRVILYPGHPACTRGSAKQPWGPHELAPLSVQRWAHVGAVRALSHIRETAQQRPHIDEMRPHRVQANRRWPSTGSRRLVRERRAAPVRGLAANSAAGRGPGTTQGMS